MVMSQDKIQASFFVYDEYAQDEGADPEKVHQI